VRKEKWMIYLPLLGLIAFILILYFPELTSTHIPVLSDLDFDKKTNLTLTFSIAIFAAIEGYSMFKRAKMEENRHLITDARNELEKAYGPLYTLLNKVVPASGDKESFWLEFEERRKIDEIMATYPFMFPSEIYSLWQEKIRNPQSLIHASDIELSGIGIDLGVYAEFRNMVNTEYAHRVKKYQELIQK
jgi:hypothetical protein